MKRAEKMCLKNKVKVQNFDFYFNVVRLLSFNN